MLSFLSIVGGAVAGWLYLGASERIGPRWMWLVPKFLVLFAGNFAENIKSKPDPADDDDTEGA